MSERTQQAAAILEANDRGGFTIPTARLYPYQWNWDSAFAALGFSVLDRERAWTELQMLFEGQWENGMVPHILFRSNDPDYFPGPEVWQCRGVLPSSGHSQPPVASSVVAHLVRSGEVADLQRAADLFSKLYAYHRWFHEMRDPDATGLVAIVHPWESGRDNCPDWDSGMAAVEVPGDLGDYQRRDTLHVDAEQRPDQEQYDKFLSIVKFGREHDWDALHIYRNGPFLMADPGVQFILMKADRDLLWIAEKLGLIEEATQLRAWIMRSDEGSQKLWNESIGAFCARNLRTGEFSSAITNASMLAFYADAGEDGQQDILAKHALEILDVVKVGFPSWDPRHEAFDSKRYWRGPVWAVMNYMIIQGFSEHGRRHLAQRVQDDTLRMISEAGYYEYFDPLSGAGLGGTDFTWTAAIELILAAER